uniref:KH homology domain-containing protein 4 n=1 Tax=Eptatretus burgeri TaxID=7764 RepID=A0A8C4X1X2_EPTBU
MDGDCPARQSWYPPRFNPRSPNPEEKFLHHKLFVGLDEDVQGFDVCSCILGPGGTFLGHIEFETGAKVELCGGRFAQRAYEPLHLLISHIQPDGLQAARNLCKDLLDWIVLNLHKGSVYWDLYVYSELERFQRQMHMQPQYCFGRYARPHSPPGNTSYTEARQKHQGQWPKRHSRNADASRSPWITPEVMDLIEQKRKANIMRLKKPSPSNEEAFRILRSRVQTEVRRLKERSMPGRRRIQQLEKHDLKFDSLSDSEADSPGEQKDSVICHKVDVDVDLNVHIGTEFNSPRNLNTEPNTDEKVESESLTPLKSSSEST